MVPPQHVVRPASDEDWEPYRSVIRKLWWDEDRTLVVVSEMMKVFHNFYATDKQYKRMLDKWDLGKNIKNHEMKAIAKIQARRRPKDTEFIIREKVVPQAKIDRFLRRTMGTADPSPSAFSPMMFTPLEVFYFTPITSFRSELLCPGQAANPNEISPPSQDLTRPVGPDREDKLLDVSPLLGPEEELLFAFRRAVETDDVETKRHILEGRFHSDALKYEETILHLAVRRRDIQSLQLLLEHGANPNSRDGNELPPLFYAMFWKDNPMIKQLLASGADPNFTDSHGNTLVHHAANDRYSGVLKLLLEHGADPNSKDSEGFPALYYAVAKAKKEMAEDLLASGADPNFKDEGGQALVHLAVQMRNSIILQLLLKHGANINAAFHAIIQEVNWITWQFFEDGFDPNFPDELGNTLVHYATKKGCSSSVRILGFHGADLNLKDNHGCTPLLIAVDRRNESMVRVLLKYGANPNIAGSGGGTPLLHAMTDKMVAHPSFQARNIMKRLLGAGADVTTATKNGQTPLHLAVKYGDLGLLKFLVSHIPCSSGSSTWRKYDLGDTIREGSSELVERILQNRS